MSGNPGPDIARHLPYSVGSYFIIVIVSLFCWLTAYSAAQAESAPRWTKDGFLESADPSSELPGYRPLKKVLVGLGRDELLKLLDGELSEVEFVTPLELGKNSSANIDAVLLSCAQPNLLANVSGVAWLHAYSAGVETCLQHPSMSGAKNVPIFTNGRGAAASVIAEHAIAMTMALSRGLHRFRDEQLSSRWSRSILNEGGVTTTLEGKTMLVLGLGSVGKQVARKANALGMRVVATRNRSKSGPDYVDYVGLASETMELSRQADVIVNALPLTNDTKGLLDKDFFAVLKPSALLISVGRGGTTDTDALIHALENKLIAGAGLDVTDPEPLPAEHPLWQQRDVIITPHLAGTGGEGRGKAIRLAADNLRRYQAGQPLLNLVDVDLGY